jgi:hypothetical protein
LEAAPPSIESIAPAMNDALSEARKMTPLRPPPACQSDAWAGDPSGQSAPGGWQVTSARGRFPCHCCLHFSHPVPSAVGYGAGCASECESSPTDARSVRKVAFPTVPSVAAGPDVASKTRPERRHLRPPRLGSSQVGSGTIFFSNGKHAYAARKMGNLTARIAAGRQVPGFWCMPLNHHQSIIRGTRRSLTLSKLTRPNPHSRSWPPKAESGPLPRSLPRGGTGKPLRQHVRRPCAHCPDQVRSGHSL